MKRYLSLLLALIIIATMIPTVALSAFAEDEYATGLVLPTSATFNENLFKKSRVQRISGDTRYDTSIAIANKLKVALGVSEFDTIIVAYGRNYADALAGSYLAALTNAPILIVNTDKNNKNDKDSMALVKNYINKNLASDGTVYVLGGTAVISNSYEKSLKASGRTVKRLAGANRYETNVKILLECLKYEENPDTILVCDAYNYADSLSVSSLGKPILLIDKAGKKLTGIQKAYLAKVDLDKAYIIGGTAAVPTSFEKAMKSYCSVSRISGETRYETSAKIAEKFFDKPTAAVLAYGHDFPDGLCGGALAYVLGAPMLLTKEDSYASACDYVEQQASNALKNLVVLGGTKAISKYQLAVYKTALDPSLLSENEAVTMCEPFLIAASSDYINAVQYYENGDIANTINYLVSMTTYLSKVIDICGDHKKLSDVKENATNAYAISAASIIYMSENGVTSQIVYYALEKSGTYLNAAVDAYYN